MSPKELVTLGLLEDMPKGDITTDPLNLNNLEAQATLVAKQDLTLSGSALFTEAFVQMQPDVRIEWAFKDGDKIFKSQTVAIINGQMSKLLKSERVALNFLGLLSGVATKTTQFVEACSDGQTKILDTRKTIPGYRNLLKQAVVDGGGKNHRHSLSDQVLIKENHISLSGGMTQTIEKIRAAHPYTFIEVEVTNEAEIQEAIENKVNRIMLDNMSDEQLEKALNIIPKQIETEASGNMNLERVKRLAPMGLNFISVGAITHSAPVADFSIIMEL